MRKKTNRPRHGWALGTGATEPAGQAGAAPRARGASPGVLSLNAAAPARSIPVLLPLALPERAPGCFPPASTPQRAMLRAQPLASCLPRGLFCSGRRQNAALIINLCRKPIQKPLYSFTACNSALPTVPS